MKKIAQWIFFVLVMLSLTASWWVFRDLLFPYVTSKAFFFRICLELALPFYVYLLVADKSLRPSLKNPLHILVAVFWLWNLFTSFTGIGPVRSLWGNFERMGGTFYLLHLVLLYFYVVALGQMSGKFFQLSLKVFLWISAVVAVNGVFGWLGMPILIQDPSLPVRVSSTLGNPIYLGNFIIIPMFLSWFFALQAEGRAGKIGWGFLGLVFLLAGYLSGTRGAAVGILAGSFISFILYLFLSQSRKIKIYGFAAVAALLVIAGLLFANSNHLPQGSTLQRLFKLKDSNTSARIIQWQVALSGFKDRPFLGTGPEDYYLVANYYHNPEIAKYDRSWFDKPHNYWLEVLVTTGVLGLGLYLAVFVLSLWALHRGFRAGLYGLAEYCLMVAAIIAYQIQNLTVFDNVSSSLTYYVFLGFAGTVWHISRSAASGKNKQKFTYDSDSALPVAAAGVAGLIILYVLYAANIIPMRIAKYVNYGYAYGSVDAAKGLDYFEKMSELPFNFDKTESANRFADFANSAARSATAQNQALVGKVIDQAINFSESAAEQQDNYAITWQRLSGLYILKSGSAGMNPLAEEYAQKAIDLAPNREEPYFNLVQIRALQNRLPEAMSIVRDLIEKYPGDPVPRTQMATLYRMQNKLPQAAELMEQAFGLNYTPGGYAEIRWLPDYYASTGQVQKALSLVEKSAQAEPNNVVIFTDMAKLFAMNREYSKALDLAQKIIKADPSQKSEMQKLIDSLPKQ